MRKVSTYMLILLLCLVWVTIPNYPIVKAEANTIVVPDDYSSIQEAIDNALVGDTIYVKSGTYHENLVVNRPLSLVGENVDTTIIDGNPPEGYRIPIKIQCDNVTVSGFKLLYGYAGISVGDAKYCSISGNRIAGNQHGITLVSSSYCNITRNYFELIGLSSAVQLSYSTNNLVAGNYIDSCTEGIQLRENSENNVVSENTIINCDDVAIRLLYSDRNTISTNNISDSGVGTSIYVSNENDISNNCYLNNTIQISANEWYAQQWGYGYSNNTITLNYWSDYNGIDSNGDGIGDTPYIIDENNQDNSPLMEPEDIEVILEFPSWTPLLIMLVAIAAVALIYRRRLAEKQRRADK